MNVFDYFFENSKYLEKDFVLGNRETISYRDLYENSLKIASFLNQKIGEDQNVIIISKNSIFFIMVYLGVLKSGNICVPLDFSIEKGNFDYISSLTNCKIVICENNLLKKLNISGTNNVLQESKIAEIIKNKIDEEFHKTFDHNRLAELIFTSGSTGKPKGVMLTHLNIISNTNSIVEYLKISASDIVLSVLPFYYCYGLSLLHSHLRAGGSIVINNTFMFFNTVVKDLIEFECTSFSGVPSHFQILLRKSKLFIQSKYPHLKYVTQAGGKLHNNFIKEFIDLFPNTHFFVMYGQTEATSRLSYLSPELIHDKLGSIGKAIPDVKLKIVNEKGIEADVNETGEILAKGQNVMKGYYLDHDETNKTIRDGWLRTGDLAKKDKDGFIYITARVKEIIKVGGKRISPKEVESVILSVDEVVDCKVEGFYDEIQGEALKAIITINNINLKQTLEIKIKKICKNKLSLYKIPRIFEFNTMMKMKSNGKI